MNSLDIFGLTDVGCVRSGNEDCFIVQPMNTGVNELNLSLDMHELPEEGLLLAVSDGMGGAAAGEVASSMTLNKLAEYLVEHLEDGVGYSHDQRVLTIEKGVQYANQQVSSTAMANHHQRGMGSTLTAMFLFQDIAYFFQVGDSKAFVLREEAFCPVTRDQSFVGQLVEMGTITPSQAAKHPQRNVILQALGTQDTLKVDISYLPLCEGDLIILSSDGLHSEIDESLIHDLSKRGRDEASSIQTITEDLLGAAKKSGGQDNITIIGVEVKNGFPPRQPGEDPALLQYPFLDLDNPLSRSFKI